MSTLFNAATLALVVLTASATPLPGANPSAANCTTRYYESLVDHFSWRIPPFGNTTWQQKVLVCGQEWFDPQTGAIFFYAGNEGDV